MNQNQKQSVSRDNASIAKKVVLVFAGTICFLLGFVGLLVRLLPTTPFFLLGSWCYINGSEKLYTKLINSWLYQKYMKNIIEKRGLHPKAKILILGWVWVLVIVLIVLAENRLIQILLASIAVIKTLVFIFVVKTMDTNPSP